MLHQHNDCWIVSSWTETLKHSRNEHWILCQSGGFRHCFACHVLIGVIMSVLGLAPDLAMANSIKSEDTSL